jgi:hypothetical protein
LQICEAEDGKKQIEVFWATYVPNGNVGSCSQWKLFLQGIGHYTFVYGRISRQSSSERNQIPEFRLASEILQVYQIIYIYSKQLWYHKYRMYRMAMLVHVLIHSHLRKHMEILTLKGNLCSFGRTDEDAEGEDLFFQHISAYNDVRSQIPY